MTLRETISHLRKSPLDAWYYIQGSLRLIIYRSKYKNQLLRKHIIQQYEWRRDIAALDCYYNGSCECCGCTTPDVFFADKPCSIGKKGYEFCSSIKSEKCYDEMLSKKDWIKINA